MSRDTHLCTYNGFAEQFQKLLNDNASIIYHNPIIYECYGDEIDSENTKDIFAQQMLAFLEFDKLKDTVDRHDKRKSRTAVYKCPQNFESFRNEHRDCDVAEFIEDNYSSNTVKDRSKARVSLGDMQKYVLICLSNSNVIFSSVTASAARFSGYRNTEYNLIEAMRQSGRDQVLQTTFDMLRTSWIHPPESHRLSQE